MFSCGTQTTYTISSTIKLCGGLSVMAGKPATPSLLWESCTCYDPTNYAYPALTDAGWGLISSMVPSPASTPITTTATSFGVFVAEQVATFVPLPVENIEPPVMTLYSYNVWAGVAIASSLSQPNYCSDIHKKYSMDKPTTGNLYPTTSLANIVWNWNSDAKTKTCEWLPDQTDGPGSLSCNSDPTSVGCSKLQVASTWCASAIAYEHPVLQCQWTEGLVQLLEALRDPS